jgi:hypothetical protein
MYSSCVQFNTQEEAHATAADESGVCQPGAHTPEATLPNCGGFDEHSEVRATGAGPAEVAGSGGSGRNEQSALRQSSLCLAEIGGVSGVATGDRGTSAVNMDVSKCTAHGALRSAPSALETDGVHDELQAAVGALQGRENPGMPLDGGEAEPEARFLGPIGNLPFSGRLGARVSGGHEVKSPGNDEGSCSNGVCLEGFGVGDGAVGAPAGHALTRDLFRVDGYSSDVRMAPTPPQLLQHPPQHADDVADSDGAGGELETNTMDEHVISDVAGASDVEANAGLPPVVVQAATSQMATSPSAQLPKASGVLRSSFESSCSHSAAPSRASSSPEASSCSLDTSPLPASGHASPLSAASPPDIPGLASVHPLGQVPAIISPAWNTASGQVLLLPVPPTYCNSRPSTASREPQAPHASHALKMNGGAVPACALTRVESDDVIAGRRDEDSNASYIPVESAGAPMKSRFGAQDPFATLHDTFDVNKALVEPVQAEGTENDVPPHIDGVNGAFSRSEGASMVFEKQPDLSCSFARASSSASLLGHSSSTCDYSSSHHLFIHSRSQLLGLLAPRAALDHLSHTCAVLSHL